jgi:hypothetical protein
MKTLKFTLLLIGLLKLNSEIIAQASFYDSTTNLFGMIDKAGKEILKPTYPEISRLTNNTCVFFDGKKYGLLNELGKIILNPIYSEDCSLYDSQYSEGLINIVKRRFLNEDSTSWDEDRAYVNKNGELIIDYMDINYAGKFCNGKAIIGKYDSNYDFIYNVIDRNGNIIFENWEPDFNNLKAFNDCFNEIEFKEETLVKENIVNGNFVYKNEKMSIQSNLCNKSYAIYYQSNIDRVLIFTTDNKLFLLNGKGDIIKEISSDIDLADKTWDGNLQFFNNGFIQVRIVKKNYDFIEYLLNYDGKVVKKMVGKGPLKKNDCNYGNH